MKKYKENEKKIIGIIRFFLILLSTLFLAAGVGTAILGTVLTRNYHASFDASLYAGKPLPPRLYAWRFSDRSARVGEIYLLEDEVLSGNGCETFVPYDELPDDLVNAFIAIEDKRFRSHHGIDWIRLGGAALNYLGGDDHPFGASTITQQLVKNVTGRDEVTLKRKLTELVDARELERQMSKEEILEHYLNVINLAEGCFGVGTAARFYFDKDVSELTLAEDAALAAITQNPVRYDPIRHPDENRTRRRVVLSEMLSQGLISETEYETAHNADLELRPRESGKRFTSWYTETVVSDVLRDLRAEYGYSRAEAERLLYHGGLSIEVAVDEEIQDILEEYYADETRFPVDPSGKRAESGVVVIDPKTGDLLGVVGAIGRKNGDRLQNFATDTLRPAGSVIKPLAVYAPALEKGLITWGSVYDDVPVRFGEAGKPDGTGLRPWPMNAGQTWKGLVDIPYAVAHSLNTVPVRILEQLGTRVSFDFLRDRFHLQNLAPEDRNAAALALGQQETGLTLREVTAAYTVFPNAGKYTGARSYYRVLGEDGEILLSTVFEPETVLSPENAYIMTRLLEGVIREGTASDVTLGERVECAGKTGTTSYEYDKWFVGYTPEVLAGVWVGMEYPSEMVGASHAATRVWDEVMQRIYATGKFPLRAFHKPANVVSARYCADSGDLPGQACGADVRGDRERMGFFVRGTEPRKTCSRHLLVAYDKDGGVANDFCPEDMLSYVGMIRVERHFPCRIYVADAQFAYRQLPSDVLPATDPNQPFFAGLYGEGDHPGLSYGIRQFNRACARHTEETKKEEKTTPYRHWWDRFFAGSDDAAVKDGGRSA